MKITLAKFFLWKYYFIRGHNQYLAFIISIFNFIVIQFELVWRKALESFGIYISIFDFTVIFGIIYFPIIIYLGRFDIKHRKGSLKVEQNLIKQNSPIYIELFETLERLEQKIDDKR